MSSSPAMLDARLPSFVDTRPVSKRVLVACATIVIALYCSLWSPYWYPLSDSALYLSLAKSLANGEGFQFLGETNRLSAPLTPILLAIILRWGGGFGAMHSLMIGLMLVGLGLTYLTLHRWVGARAALAATLAASISFWAIQCTTTVMTEPLCLALFWGLLYCLTRAVQTQSRGHRTLWLAAALLLFFASFENRAAMILLLPGILIAFWNMAARETPRIERIVWIGCFCVVLGTAFWDYRYSGQLTRFISQVSLKLKSEPISESVMPTTKPENFSPVVLPYPPVAVEEQQISPAVVPAPVASQQQVVTAKTPEVSREEAVESEIAASYASQNSRYRFSLPPLAEMANYPYHFGRWICEGLMAPSIALFQTKNVWLMSTGYLISLTALALTIVGLCLMLAQRQWWVLGLVTYCLPIWMIWSSRIIPRYMVPFAPVFFLLIWYALSWIAVKVRQKYAAGSFEEKPLARFALAGLSVVLLLGNLPPLAIEIYLRHAPGTNFYEVARCGATKELLQIGAYIRENSSETDMVACNATFFHRVVHFVTERQVKNLYVGRRDLQKVMRESKCSYIIVFSTDQAPWPNWHLPWAGEAPPHSWWQLYVRKKGGHYTWVNPTRIQVADSSPNLLR